MKKLWTISFCILILMLLSNNSIAFNGYLDSWKYTYPDSSSSASSCILCHGEKNSQLNEYGLDIKIQLANGKEIETAIQDIQGIDSDMDPGGFSNIEEISAGTQPGWTVGANNMLYTTNGEPIGTADQNSPFQGDLDPVAENQDPVARANGPYSGNVDDPVSFSSSGSSDSDGSIQTYSWSFGDGSTSAEPNPTHTYTAAGTYSIVLTVTDDFGASGTDTSAAVITVPPANEPDIDVTSNSLSFDQVEVGQTQSRTIDIRNIGTQTLNITAIALCDGTSTEYSWSPDPTIIIGTEASQTLTVFYNPVDQNSDEGCLQITSNDPDENAILLNLAGSGFIPQPEMMDIDIAGFQVGKRVSLTRVKPIKIKLVVKNKSTIIGPVDVTVTGSIRSILEGSILEVYKETVTVNLNRNRTTILLPEYIPVDSDIGIIDWKAEVKDEVPDQDTATATTKVVP